MATTTKPFFELSDFAYFVDSDPLKTNIRDTCPITYDIIQQESPLIVTNSSPFTWSVESGNDGYDGIYKITLGSFESETPGTYSITIKGTPKNG